MRIIHTSDWHLGHQLHQTQREYEFRALIDWMLTTLETQKPDAFLLAGDIFDTANPPIWAIHLWHQFLGRLHRVLPNLDVVVIGGNHDSPSRLEASNPILQELDIHIVGGVPWHVVDGKRTLDLDRLILPLHDAAGAVQAWVVAMPFIRMGDLNPAQQAEGDPFVAAFAELYQQVIAAAQARTKPGQRLLVMGHAYLRGGQLSEWSERKVLGGNQHAIPVSVFPETVDYVALGHLHLAQAVGGRQTVRYSGAPLPLSFHEADYPHQVRCIAWEGEDALESHSIAVPKAVEFIRVPTKGDGELAAIEQTLADLPERSDQALETLPYLEVRVLLTQPQPDLRRRIVNLLEDKAVRLLKITVAYQAQERGDQPLVSLSDVEPEQVFRQRYRQQFEGEPSDVLMAHFHRVLEEAEAEL